MVRLSTSGFAAKRTDYARLEDPKTDNLHGFNSNVEKITERLAKDLSRSGVFSNQRSRLRSPLKAQMLLDECEAVRARAIAAGYTQVATAAGGIARYMEGRWVQRADGAVCGIDPVTINEMAKTLLLSGEADKAERAVVGVRRTDP